MTRMGPLPGLLLSVVVACGACGVLTAGSEARDTPEQAFERLRRAVRSQDWAAVYSAAASPAMRRLFERDFEKVKATLVKNGGASMFAESVLRVSTEEYLRMNAQEYFVRMSEAAGDRDDLLVMIPDAKSLRDARIVDTRIDGDEAWLFLDLDEETRPLELFREDGRWYFQLLDLD